MNTEYWLTDGGDVKKAAGADRDILKERRLYRDEGAVRVLVEDTSVVISWSQFAPNWASLFRVLDWLPILPNNVTLEFYNAGWFTENYHSTEAAANRIDQLIARSDTRLSTRTYIAPQTGFVERWPCALRDAWVTGNAPIEKSVICSVDPVLERSEVMFVGLHSALANVWGTNPLAYPCQSGNSYDRTVSRPYFDVIKSDKPYHDHVLAALTAPNGDVRWFGYQRVIFPGLKNASGKPTVRVMSELAPVDIRLP